MYLFIDVLWIRNNLARSFFVSVEWTKHSHFESLTEQNISLFYFVSVGGQNISKDQGNLGS